MDYEFLYYDLFCDDRILTLSAGRTPDYAFSSLIGSGVYYTDYFDRKECNISGQKLMVRNNTFAPDYSAFKLRDSGKIIDGQLTYTDLTPSKALQRLAASFSANLSGVRIMSVPARVFGDLTIGGDVVPMTGSHVLQLRLSYNATPERMLIATAVDNHSSALIFYAVSDSDKPDYRRYCCVFKHGNVLYSFNSINSMIKAFAEGQRINITLTAPSKTIQFTVRQDGEFDLGIKQKTVIKSVNSHLQAELSTADSPNIIFASRCSTLNIGSLKVKSEEGQRVFAH